MLIRRSVIAALCLLLLAASNVAAATSVSISSSAYSPTSVTVAMGGSIKWKNTTGKKHTVTSDAFFLWGTLTVRKHTTSSALTFQEAGTFPYHDSNSPAHGQVAVPMKVDATYLSLGGTVTLSLGTAPPSGPVWHVVQGRVNGGAWATVATTGTNSTGFTPTKVGTWEFQTYLHHALSNTNSGTSPVVTVTVS